MGKYLNPYLTSLMLEEARTTATHAVPCAGQPTTFAEASQLVGQGGKALGSASVTLADLTISPAGNGLRLTLAAKDVTFDVSAIGDHYALIDATGNRLLVVTTVSSFAAMTGNTETFHETVILELRDSL
jgi:hypothetical protein